MNTTLNAFEPIYPFAEAPAAGSTLQVAPGVLWVRMPLPFALDHINLWLLEDGEGYALVDTGIALPSVQADWERILAALGKPLTRIIVTHFHPDHIGLADWMQRKTGAPLLMSTGEFLTAKAVWAQTFGHSIADMLAQFRSHGVAPDAATALEQRGNAYNRGVPALPATYERLRAGQQLRIGAHDWQVIIGHGHAVEHVALYSASAGILISGDMLLPRITPNIAVFASTPDADALQHYFESLEAFAPLPDSVLALPAHGRPFRNVAGRVAGVRAHHAQRLAKLEAACDEPRAAGELLEVLFDRTGLDPHQTMFAMGEAIAHVNHLHHAGRLIRSRDANGVWRFQRAAAS